MESSGQNLTGIKVQTARMLEIYALLRSELQQLPPPTFRTQDVEQLHKAIATVEANMRQLQEHLVQAKEHSAAGSSEARELDEILNAVLAWAQDAQD